tara:strand:+ start:142 stop:1371 length:1230 start_codon:yes stop_codon:yes gene_type:complete
MTSIPYSTKPVPTINELRNVNVNPATLANGDVVSWDTTLNIWKNTAGGGGGGGATITGTDDAVVFKSGANGVAPSDGITKNVVFAGYAMNLDTANFRVGIGGASNAQNPANTLEIYGGARFKAKVGFNEIVIDDDTIGNIIGGTSLKLYSSNTLTPENICVVDSLNRTFTVGGTSRTLPPTVFDLPNSTLEDGIYKIRLQQGMDLWAGAPPFDAQNPLSNATTAFPVGQVVEYQNNQPIQDWRCISRLANNFTLIPAVPYPITNFGTFSAFTDRMIYDPMGCRTRLAGGSQWQWCGAPSVLRVADNKFFINVKWYVDGIWSLVDPINQLDIYVNQYRNALLFRQFLVSTAGSPSASYHSSGERTFMGFAPYGEDFDCITDDYQIELVNFGGNSFTIGTTQCEFKFTLAQ